jgi:hypothetical protein
MLQDVGLSPSIWCPLTVQTVLTAEKKFAAITLLHQNAGCEWMPQHLCMSYLLWHILTTRVHVLNLAGLLSKDVASPAHALPAPR